MAAPSSTVWGSIVNSKHRLGIYVSMSGTNATSDTVTVTIETWFWSKWSCSDKNNTYYFNNESTSATTNMGSKTIYHTVDSGSWSTSNQTKIGSHSYTYSRTSNDRTISCAAKFVKLGSEDSTVYCTTSYTIPSLTTYTVSYVANGGWGAPSAQIKYYDVALTISSTRPTRDGYTFKGWSTSSAATSVDYSPGSYFYLNANTNLYAVWGAKTYMVSYNANGGTGAPGIQTKIHDVALTLSSTIPTRTNYTFQGWGTSASSTTVSYAAGAQYTANNAISLFAVWKLAWNAPRISSLNLYRVNSSGSHDELGTYFYIGFSWSTDKTVSSITIKYKKSSETSWTSISVSASGTSGTVNRTTGSGAISIESLYDIQIVIADSVGSTTINRTLAGTKFMIDFLSGGNGVAIGKPSEIAGLFEVDLPAQFNKAVDFDGAVGVKGNKVQTKRCIVGVEAGEVDTSNCWFKVADTRLTSSYTDERISFKVTYAFAEFVNFAILNVSVRSNGDASAIENDNSSIVLESNTGIDPSYFMLFTTTNLAEIWVKIPYTWARCVFDVISESTRETKYMNSWNLYDGNTTPDYPGASDQVFKYATAKLSATSIYSDAIYDKYDLELTNGLAKYTSSGIDPNTTLEHLILTHLNTPNGGYMYIKTEFYNGKSTSNSRMQTAFPFNSLGQAYYRYYDSGSWTVWMPFGTALKPGDTYTVPASSQIFGVVTGSAQVVQTTLYLGTPIIASSISLSGNFIIRGDKGYLNSMDYQYGISVSASSYSCSATIADATRGVINIRIEYSSGFTNVTNNTPVALSIPSVSAGLVLTFN